MLPRNAFLLLVGISSILATGCTQPAAPPNGNPPSANAGPGSTADLSVPRLDPRPVIWQEDRVDEEAVPQPRTSAQGLMSLADRLKASERFEEATKVYEQAIEADPTWGYPAYQLACNYELSGQHDLAVAQFKKAIEVGFDDFPTALTDDELGRIRDRSDFDAALREVRKRYIASSQERVGQPIAIRPAGDRPTDGWPVMFLLHGFGDTNLSYLDNAAGWAKLGFLAVAVPGSVPARDGHYIWSMDSIEPTHQDLQLIVESPLLDGLINRNQVFLLGFSQGALHAMLLTAEHPDDYAGVVGISPGGSLASQLATPPINGSGRGARCFFIHGDQEPHAPFVKIWSAACRKAGWKFDSQTHPGSHHFPDNWDELRPRVAAFLTG